MALAARALGHEYLAITDHSASHGFGNEVSPTALERQIEMVAEIDARLDGIRVLAGSEVNVLPDGSLDYEDELLARLDWIVASVHTSFRMSADAMTERMIRAIEHPLVDAIGHPDGPADRKAPGLRRRRVGADRRRGADRERSWRSTARRTAATSSTPTPEPPRRPGSSSCSTPTRTARRRSRTSAGRSPPRAAPG